MQKELYIHIGPPKTGSTTLQKLLAEQADSDQPEIYYPKAGRINDGRPSLRSNGTKVYSEQYHVINHTNIFYALIGTMIDPSSDDVLCMLTKEVAESDHSPIVISSEGFFWLNEQIPKLINCLPNCSIKVLLYIRNPFNRTLSSYREKVRTENMTCSFDKFVSEEDFFVKEPAVIDRWAKYIKRENVITRPFEHITAGPGLYQDLCGLVGIDVSKSNDSDARARQNNATYTDQTLVVIRFLSKMQERCKIGGFSFLVCINLKRIISQTAVIRVFLNCILFSLRNRLISPEGRASLSNRICDEIDDMPSHYRALYVDYIES